MEKRLIVAIALSILVIVTFQHLVGKPSTSPLAPKTSAEIAKPAPSPAEIGQEEYLSSEAASMEKELEVETDKYMLTFSDSGGAIKRIKLKEYKNTRSSEPLDLVQIIDPKAYIFATSGRINSHSLGPIAYRSERTSDAVSYELNLAGCEVVKRYTLHNSNYIIDLHINIKNTSSSSKEVGYEIVGGSGILEPSAQDKRFIEITANIDGKIVNVKRPKRGERITTPGSVSWTALKSKYFSLILKPFVKTRTQSASELSDGTVSTGVEPETVVIPPNHFVEHRYILYVGPGKISALKESGLGLEESVNYGFFGAISKILLSLMGLIYRIVGNWGLSIIILSVILNIVLFPLSIKSFKSMKKMQELHPQMEKLKAQYKDNAQKLNKEIMELYKKYNINPFSGCLPLILQMPIFIALYNALIRAIDLKGANFLWIKDLSLPDGVRIPFSLPIIGNSINILPLLMIAAMVVQQKISTKSMGGAVTAEQKQQQQMMLIMMPVIFGLIFYNMPSGLVLYWLVNTVLTMLEQLSMAKKT